MAEMTCSEMWREISEYIDDEVEPELRARMDAYFEGCDRCRCVLASTRNVITLVVAGWDSEPPAGFSKRLHDPR